MTGLIRRIAIASLCAAFAAPAIASAQAGMPEAIREFDVRAAIGAGGEVRVTERIVYDFGSEERHGIVRRVPARYRTDFGSQSMRLTDIRAEDDRGYPYAVDVSSEGAYESIRIGDPDATVRGTKTYVLTYTAHDAIGYFETYDELYWNATGNEWDVPIVNARATIVFPAPVDAAGVRAACYLGQFGSAERCSEWEPPVGGVVDGVTFESPRPLMPREGLTLAAGFPKGLVSEPSLWARYAGVVRDNPVILLPFAVFGLMFALWYRNGRDPKGRGAVVPEYDAPDGLTPLEVSAVMKQNIGGRDISAEIISLATRGWLTIERKETVRRFLPDSTDYEFARKEGTGELAPFDKAILDGMFTDADPMKAISGAFGAIFSAMRSKRTTPFSAEESKGIAADASAGKATVLLSDLKNKFYKRVPEIKKAVMLSVVEKGYYPS